MDMLSNTEIQQPVIKLQFRHSLKYAWIVLFPMIPISAFLFDSRSLWAWALPVVSYVIIPIAEQFLPQSEENLSKEEEKILKDSFFHKFFLLFMLPIQWLLIALLIWELQTVTWAMLDARIIGLIISVGISCATFGINIGHELGHRNDRVSQFAAIASLRDNNHLECVILKVKKSIKKLEEIAISNNCKFIKSYTNFLAIDCGYDGIFAKNVLDFLISNGIFVRMPFTSPENRCIRVSAGTDEDLKLFQEKFPLALANAKKKLNLK